MKCFNMILFAIILISIMNNVQGAALMGGHFDNINRTAIVNLQTNNEDTNLVKLKDSENTENDSSSLLLRGYSLPNHLFNDGKPFYVDKDPLTGAIDFNSKTSADETDYNNNSNLPKENDSIDRKDSNIGSYTKNDMNKISPNFHDYLNLPVKYTSTKYTYPLISSSYANMKIQGNNKNNIYNHKDYKITTYKPPTYFSSTAAYTSKPYTTTTSNLKTMQTTEKPIITSTEKTSSLLSDLFDVFNIDSFADDSSANTDKSAVLNESVSVENTKEQNIVDHNVQTNTKHLNFNNSSFVNNGMTMDTLSDDNFQHNESSNSFTNLDFNNSLLNNTHSTEFNIENMGEHSDEDLYNDYEYDTTALDNDTNNESSSYINKNEAESSPEDYWNPYMDNYFDEKQNNSRDQLHANQNFMPTLKPANKEPEYLKQNINNKYNIKYYNQNNNSQSEYNIKDENMDINNDSQVQKSPKNEYNQYHTNEWSAKVVFPDENKNTDNYKTESNIYENNLNKNYINNKKYGDKYAYKTIELNTNNDVKPVEHLNKTHVVFQNEVPSIPIATSLPLGINHPGKNPIIAFSHNLREQLNNERVTLAHTTHFPSTLPTIASTARPEKFTPEYKKPSETYINLFGNINNRGDQSGIIPSKSNIHIAPNQDTVSFVIGNQHAINSGYFIGGVENGNQYDNSFSYAQNNLLASSQDNINNFYNEQNNSPSVTHMPTIMSSNKHYASPLILETVNLNNSNIYAQTNNIKNSETVSLHIKPIIGSEASVGIGIPPHGIKTIPGQVVDEKIELNQDNIEKLEGPLTKIIFPNNEADRVPTTDSVGTFHLQSEQNIINSNSASHLSHSNLNLPDREILSLNSKPMFHQLPSDLTPPEETGQPNIIGNYPKPPWDPRPGHFFNGRPEYARPSQSLDALKRLQNRPLPNILPQFRPNAKVSYGHHVDNVGTISHNIYLRQQNHHHERPVGFFEHLQPPPPPRKIITEHLRKNSEMKLHRHSIESNKRISNAHLPRYPVKPIENIDSKATSQTIQEHLGFLRTPPKIPQRQIANRRNGDNDVQEVATLQMLQSKHVDSDIDNRLLDPSINIAKINPVNNSLYVVYPVNSSPMQLDVLDTDKQETVVIGTRGEQPLPPSKIHDSITQHEKSDQDILLTFGTRDDKPILKPQTRPNNFPIKSDFPYPLERPEISDINFREKENKNNIELKALNKKHNTQNSLIKLNNQWTNADEDIQSRIVNYNKNVYQDPNIISATLKSLTEKPIAIAYTPTDSSININKYNVYDSHYSDISNKKSEFTVSATMHTHPQLTQSMNSDINNVNILRNTERNEISSHRINLETDVDTTHVPIKLDFQAPFQASLSVDSPLEGWSVIKSEKNDNKSNDVTISKLEENSSEENKESVENKEEFDIENFKPELYGGFKPIFSFPDNDNTTPKETLDREE